MERKRDGNVMRCVLFGLFVCLLLCAYKAGKQSFYSKQFTYIKHLSLWPSSSVFVYVSMYVCVCAYAYVDRNTYVYNLAHNVALLVSNLKKLNFKLAALQKTLRNFKSLLHS